MAPDPSPELRPDSLAHLGEQLCLHLDALYDASAAARWGLSRTKFVAAVENSVAKRFPQAHASRRAVEEYLATLHSEDLALATACLDGSEAAWEHFVQNYRPYLRATSASITRGSRSGADPQELADSLFAELYGLVDGKRGEASLFRYFHGRSSLKTWLRTVLAQRHIDCLRQARRWESIDQDDGEKGKVLHIQSPSAASLDPHRERYLLCFTRALTDCLGALESRDRLRLELYYAQEKTLAEIGRVFGEHESSASRHLERTRGELRANVANCLRTGLLPGGTQPAFTPLSDAEIALCFQYAAADAPIDFRNIFPDQPSGKNSQLGRKGSP